MGFSIPCSSKEREGKCGEGEPQPAHTLWLANPPQCCLCLCRCYSQQKNRSSGPSFGEDIPCPVPCPSKPHICCDFLCRPPTDALRVIVENHNGPLHLYPFWGRPPLPSLSRADLNEAGETPSSYCTGPPTPTFSPWFLGPFLWLYFRSKQEKECAECFPPCALKALIPAAHTSSPGEDSFLQHMGVESGGCSSLPQRLLPFLLPCPLPWKRLGAAYGKGTELQRNSDLNAVGAYAVQSLP